MTGLALVWESSTGLRPLSAVPDALIGAGSRVRPFSAAGDPADAERRLALLSPRARALLEHLDNGGGEGTTGGARTGLSPEQAETPVEELLAHQLLVARDRTTVLLPGEVAVALRGGHTTAEPVDVVPPLATSDRDAALIDRGAAGAAFETVRRIELLLDLWSTEPPTVLRAGGLGVRDLKAAAAYLQVSEPTAALLVEVAFAADLLAAGPNHEGDPCWLPSDAFDGWCGQPVEQRWERIARAWLQSARMPALIGSRDPVGKARNALVPDLASVFASEARRMTLAELAGLEPGQVLATGTGVPSLVARVAWQRPRRPRFRDDLVVGTLEEAATLGVSGLGGLARHGRALLDDEDAAAVLAPLLPSPVDHVLLQADLTAVAPGPLEAGLARRVQLVADVESRGGATVYRFTPTSVRRAFDSGWTSGEVHSFIAEISRTPVPQPLTYLVDDTARTFGNIRVGMAEAFLRADDTAALAELLHHPKAASLGLRQIAPTVLVSSTPVDILLPRLRDLGVAPVVESPDGTVRVARRDVQRCRTPRSRRADGLTIAREQAHVAQVVTAIRAGDRAAASRPVVPAGTVSSPSSSLAALRAAIETRSPVWIGYVDNHGTSSERIIDPVRVEGGHLTAYDHRSDDIRSFAVHRITAVRAVDRRG
ncbi:helicase C-terminal domain-containing protein [Nocardioides speluncae]|uniref:helicase C-terminal domain-containing protein n=1 Tax=Nocardioides speluncae TaxID=2670337 RepID=UPI001F0BA930|nr:helicase C-terminal domain-containing protein [Nocardioides speluncae]